MSAKMPQNCMVVSSAEEAKSSLERFWKLDQLEPIRKYRTPEERHCEKHFINNLQHAQDGRLIVRLPFSEDPSALGKSCDIATRRFYSLEKRTCPEIKRMYNEFMAEYEKLGHMKQVMPDQIPKAHYFIPHHCALKPESTTTKLRVVFDASCKTSSGKSLNDVLHPGPVVQSDLFSILLRFRTHKYVFTADIEKMYRQVWLNPNDQFNQMIVWRYDSNEPIKYYRLKTVTYGTTSAPFLATKCLEHLANINSEKWPLGAAALKNDFYVDDCLTGADTIQDAERIQQELNKILLPCGFKLRKWCSNTHQLLKGFLPEDVVSTINLGAALEHTSVKTLGIIWTPKDDHLCGRAQEQKTQSITKRVVASEVGQIFDPLGLFSPVIIRAKIFLQTLSLQQLDWDTEISDSLKERLKIKMPTEIIDLPHHHISAYVALFLSLGVIVVYLWKRFQKKTPPQTSSSSKDIELAEHPRLLSSSRMHHLMPSSDAFEINIG
nr:uncharacterized protein LOC123003501 [Drosophila takahashii]